ncbi:MAG: hypothetical protein AAFO63_13200 [Pseudomonadota bacterium]
MEDKPDKITCSMLRRVFQFELEILQNALLVLEDFRKSPITQCSDDFLRIESLIALSEAKEAASNLTAVLAALHRSER